MTRLGDFFRRTAGAPLRALMPRNPWLRALIIGLPILLLLALFEPVIDLLARGAGVLVDLFTPFLDNPIGRLILVNVLLFIFLLALFYLFRGRYRELRGGLVLGRQQQGVAAYLQGEERQARDLFAKVVRYRGQPPREYPHLVADARLKLARMALEAGLGNEAVTWLASIREKSLPRELKRSLLQLKVEAYLTQGEILPETVESELATSLAEFPQDLRMLALMRQMHLERGQHAEVCRLQERILKHAPLATSLAARQRLLEDFLRAGEAALCAGKLDEAQKLARRASKVEAEHPEPGCLLGKVHAARGDLRQAVREWGRSRSPRGLELIAELLDREPAVLGARELLECCPTQGGLLLVARELARSGEHDRAMRAARRAARQLEPSPEVAAILSEVMALCGQQEEARQLSQTAVLRLVAPSR